MIRQFAMLFLSLFLFSGMAGAKGLSAPVTRIVVEQEKRLMTVYNGSRLL